eukprot:CAMPEP_0181061228 /NCGR_PEP_ID=MMETSP1070-20121207/22403_1 /TAXON_ID=265543 /ORGANISM="Minutocellus polymorphus, Strain NH13" /LENGTH=298 /DNA_ID=CAMNT_0023141157 /DNA_START=96 /DNA_END=992 /DNA_ORIENTATION=-
MPTLSSASFVLALLLVAATSTTVEAFSAAAATPGTIPSIIVGGGRIGSLLKDLGTDADVIVKRGEPIPSEPPSGPIYVCTRNDVLADVVAATPESRRGDLCFLQNGMLGEFIAEQGLPADTTQCLLYLAVPSLGAPPIDGITSLNPEGLTAADGKWAEELAGRLNRGNLKCNLKHGDDFMAAALEKHIFICATNVIGQLNGGVNFGEVYSSEKYAEQRNKLIDEMVAAGSKKIGVTPQPGTADRLAAYAASVADFPTGVKEFEWRNGWFYDISKKAMEAGEEDPMPFHTEALKTLDVL